MIAIAFEKTSSMLGTRWEVFFLNSEIVVGHNDTTLYKRGYVLGGLTGC